MTILLTHITSISLTTLPKPLPPSIAPPALPLPSRFPSSSTPLTEVSSTGHIYLYSSSGHVVWEYDGKGKRISEISILGEKINKVLALKPSGGKENVMISLLAKDEEGGELRVMEKDGVKWKCINTSQPPKGNVTALTCSSSSSLVAAGSDQGELVIFDQSKGERMVIPLEKWAKGPISPLLTFCPTLPSTLLLPTPTALLRITLPSDSSSIDIRELPIKGPILDITFSPVVESADGSKKGGLCAVLKEGGEVALVGVDSNSAPKMISFGEELEGLNFLDGASLAGRTKQGVLLVKDLRALANPPTLITCAEPITSIRLLPPIARSARPSLAPSSTSSRQTPLGNKDAGNIPTPPPMPVLKSDLKGKAPMRDAVDVQMTHGQKSRVGFKSEDQAEKEKPPRVELRGEKEKEGLKQKERVVSAPSINTLSERPKQPRQSSSRSTSGPISSSSSIPNDRRRHERKTRSETPIIEEVEEEERYNFKGSGQPTNKAEQSSRPAQSKIVQRSIPEEIVEEEEEYHEPSVQLDWVFEPPPKKRISDEEEKQESLTDRERVEEMRRELRELKMDMLRMNRGLKNEIRKAVEPLHRELLENRETIERQRREIERLRRGY